MVGLRATVGGHAGGKIGDEAQIPISGCDRRRAARYPSCAAQCWLGHPRPPAGPAVTSGSIRHGGGTGSPVDERFPFSRPHSQRMILETTAGRVIRNEPTPDVVLAEPERDLRDQLAGGQSWRRLASWPACTAASPRRALPTNSALRCRRVASCRAVMACGLCSTPTLDARRRPVRFGA
jgi:hypothetical protein